MIFRTIILENIFSHKSTEVDLYDKGLCLILGQNGSGKSSILKALLFCLFGIGADSVINQTIGKDASVTLIGNNPTRLPIADSEYNPYYGDDFTVRRYRKHNKFKNDLHFFINGKPVDAATNTDLQKKLEAYLGLDYKAFTNVAAFSNEMIQFCSATDTERKAIFEKILTDLEIYNEYHRIAKEEHIALKVEADDLAHRIEIEERELTVVKKILEAEEARVEDHEKRKQEKIEVLEAELVELDMKFKKRLRLKERRQKYQSANFKLDLWLSEHPLGDDKYFMLKQQLSDVDKKLENLSENDVCPTCLQPLPEKYKKAERRRLEGLKGIIITTIIEYEIWRERIQKVVNKFNELNEKAESIRYDLTKYDRVPDDIKRIEKELETTRDEVSGSSEVAAQWRSKIKKLSKKIAGYKFRIKETEEELLYLAEVATGFSKTGIPNVIIARALRFLEERTNTYLDILTSGAIGIQLSGFSATKKGALRNKIGIEVISSTGITTYESYSGGERQRLNISMLLALRDVAQTNKGIDLNCLFLDEILDLSLDSQGCADVLLLLQHKKRDISSIFILSPKEEFIRNTSGDFNTVYKIHKENGFSKIMGG